MVDALSHLAAAMAGRPPETCVGWRDGAAVSQAAFMARLRAWAALLRRAQCGDNVALYLEDSIEFGAALLGAWQAGKTVWLSADILESSCDALRPRVDAFLGQFPPRYAPLTAGVGEADSGAPAVIDDGAAALVVFTSGSTGAAQAVPKRLSQLGAEVATLEATFGAIVDGDGGPAGIVATVSHQHIYGLLFKVLWPLSAARPLQARSSNFPEQLAALAASRPCVLVASPAHLKRLPEHLGWDGARRHLRAVFSSGGPLAPEVGRACRALLGHVPIEVYGSSETGGIAWRQRAADVKETDQAWTMLAGVSWRLADAEDGEDGAGAPLEVRSAHLPDANWLRLADRVRAHGEHGFVLLGRSDRIVKIEEKRIALGAIEAGLLASALVEEARVLPCAAAPGERQVLAAFVVLSAAGRAALDGGGKLALNRRLRQLLIGAVDPLALPRRWRYPRRMPINGQGKTTEALLLALLEGTEEVAVEQAQKPRLPLLRLLERDARRALFEMTVPADLLYFDGHFPGAPILPGVVQIDWAITQGRACFPLPAHFRAMHALKFQQVIVAQRPLQLELLFDAAKGSLAFRYFSAAGTHASGRVSFMDAQC